MTRASPLTRADQALPLASSLTQGRDGAFRPTFRLVPVSSDALPERWVMVPRGGFQVNEIWFCFQMFVVRIATAPTNRTTNKIFLWISLVPKPRSARYDAGILHLISQADSGCYLGWPSSSPLNDIP